MSTKINETETVKSGLQQTLEAAGKIAAVAIDAETFKKRLGQAVDDAVSDAQRIANHGKHKFEDVVDDTTYLIKKKPWQSVGYVLGAGLGIGLFTGWLLARRNGSAH